MNTSGSDSPNPNSPTRLTEAFHEAAHFILHRRRAGKIARLPAPIREKINLMLLDGVPYATIVARLGDAGKGLNKDNLSRWRKADHQDWLAEQTWCQATAARPAPSPQVKHIALLLQQLDADTLKDTIARRPDKFVPTMNLMARFCHLSADPTQSKPDT
ncbi:MAG TPA: hypothetical protein VN578_13330 [Candidatus Binatia bacterium]|nr:hypothetical protein [Candidatus Binatia bacterium]